MPTTHLLFDIETRLDRELAESCGYHPKQKKDGDDEFAPIPFHVPCAIAVGHVTEGVLTHVESLRGLLGATDPRSLTEAFWQVAEHVPIWISFNGRSFDIGVMELEAMTHLVATPRHWTPGTKSTRYRYSETHQDLFAILTDGRYGAKGYSLDVLVRRLGYAGKGNVKGSDVQRLWDAGEMEMIEEYNRRDVIMLFALWLTWQVSTGALLLPRYQDALQAAKHYLDLIR